MYSQVQVLMKSQIKLIKNIIYQKQIKNIITYDLTRKTGSISKGYLYGNANSENPEYELEYDNTVDINISRVELVNTIEVRETDEYFIDMNGNRYTAEGNTYYKSVKVNREKLLSIIGENGNLELLLEDGTFNNCR